MAVAGSATSAYKCQVRDNTLVAINTTSLADLCTRPDQAVLRLERGEQVIVRGSEMAGLRRLLAAQGVIA